MKKQLKTSLELLDQWLKETPKEEQKKLFREIEAKYPSGVKAVDYIKFMNSQYKK